MPKSKINIAPSVLDYSEQLRKRYGGMMTFADVGREIGIARYASVKQFLDGVPLVYVNGRPRVMVLDLAQWIYERRAAG